MEMRCYHKIPGISYKDHVTNDEVCAKNLQAFGSHEDLLPIVKRRKLKWYGHVSRSSSLTKTIVRGTVKEGRRVSYRVSQSVSQIVSWSVSQSLSQSVSQSVG